MKEVWVGGGGEEGVRGGGRGEEGGEWVRVVVREGKGEGGRRWEEVAA